MKVAKGISVVEGIAIGRLRIYRREETKAIRTSLLTPAEEWLRFERACTVAWEQLDALSMKALEKAGKDGADIFKAHQMILKDEGYLDAVRYLIERENVTAEHATIEAGHSLAVIFDRMKDEYVQARAADVRDVSARVAYILAGQDVAAMPCDEPAILVADELTPSETVQLDRSNLLGFATRCGSCNDHTAILARTMNIPALTGVDFDDSWDGRQGIIDGGNSCVFVDPDDGVLAAMSARQKAELERMSLLGSLKNKPNVTLDGREIEICANISDVRDLDLALENDAQGIGLFRSEFLYLDAQDFPSEEAQFAIYRQVVEAMKGRKVVIRTFDIGADKQAAYFNLAREENPALGYRGIRICLTEREIFKQQLRAILRASAFGPVSVMFPMIISVQEVRDTKEILEECKDSLRIKGTAMGNVEIGIMVETPAAVVMADELAKEVDFFSLGTNDLTQYALAMDRQNPRLQHMFDPYHPAVLRMIIHTVEAGHRHGCKVGICGELGADRKLTEFFLRIGVDDLSVSPAAILPLRKWIREMDLSEENAACLPV